MREGQRSTDPLKLVSTLSLLLPSSPYYDCLSLLPAPDQANPTATTTFEAQLYLTVRSLDLHHEIAELLEKHEAGELDKQVETRRLRLDRAKKTREALVAEAGAEIWAKSELPSVYEAILSHPAASDEERRTTEAKLLRYRHKLLLALPNPASAASRVAAQGPRGTAATHLNAQQLKAKEEEEQRQVEAKGEARDVVGSMAMGMVTIAVPDDLAWRIRFDWQDCEHLTEFTAVHLRKYLELFRWNVPPPANAASTESGQATGDAVQNPTAALVYAARALLMATNDPVYLHDEKERAKNRDVDIGDTSELDALALAIAAVEADPSSIFCHRIAATLYLIDADYQSASDVATSALALVRKLEADAALSLSNVKQGLNCLMATALTHLDAPQNHARAMRYQDAVLARNKEDIEALLAKGYVRQAAGDYKQAKQLYSDVVRIASAGEQSRSADGPTLQQERALMHSKNPLIEARGEAAWCDVNAGALDEATTELKELLELIDGKDVKGISMEQKARTWWRYGECLWRKGGTTQLEPGNAFTCYITALKRAPAFAPAFTSLGIYYSTLEPPDLDRSAKCFQKAFELDAREAEAAYRLAKGFADEREWDLVEVVARRVIQGEGGANALQGSKASARLHVSKNAWAWRAIGSVELQNQKFEESIVAFQIALRAEPEDASLWHLLGEAYSRSGRHVAALKALDEARAIKGKDWEIQYSIGDVHRQMSNFEEAIAIFSDIVKEDPELHTVRISLADVHLLNGRTQGTAGYVARAGRSFVQAAEEAGTALAKIPKLRSGWKIAADACFEMARLPQFEQGAEGEAAITELLTLAQEHKADAKAPAVSAGSIKDATEALEASSPDFSLAAVHLYKLIVVLNATSEALAGSAWYDLAISLVQQAKDDAEEGEKHSIFQQSVGCIKEALKAEPYNDRFWTILGNIMLDKSIKVSQHAYIRAIECSPRTPIPWSNLGFLYLQHDDAELANEAFIRSQTLDPDWPQAWVGQGFVALKNGDAASARVLFEHAYRLSEGAALQADYEYAAQVHELFRSPTPPSSATLNAPAFALSCYLAREPKAAAALHLSSLLCERLGEHALAVERIERAASLLEAEYEASEDPQTALKYALAQVNLGRIRLAQEKAEEAIEAFEGAQALLDGAEEGEQDQSVPLARTQASIGIALAQHLSGDSAAAVGSLGTALEVISSTPDQSAYEIASATSIVMLTQARILHQAGEAESSTEALMSLLEQQPGSIAAIATLAAKAIADGDEGLLDAALSEVQDKSREQLTGLDPTGSIALLQALARLSQGKDDAALDQLKLHLQQATTDVESQVQLGEALLRQSISAEASTESALAQLKQAQKLADWHQTDALSSRLAEAHAVARQREGGSGRQAAESVATAPWSGTTWLTAELTGCS